MKVEDFTVHKCPSLSSITKHQKVEFADYERRLASMQSTVQAIQQAYLATRERAVVVLEGWDTAGKGGVVRRLGWALDPRSFKVHPIAAPSSHERGKHYLQRFWEKLPEHGQIVVFDRSWYGRVLVERVEGFATKREWRRGYAGDPARGIAPCSACHGPGGYKLGAPALQQQRTTYIESQLLAFAQGMRQNDIGEQMRTIARQLTPEEAHVVAVFYGAEAAAMRTTQQ